MRDLASFTWPNFPLPALMAAAGVALLAVIVVMVSYRFDPTHGMLTLSVMIVTAFIVASFASMIYDVPQTPTTEILLGALATSLGGIVAFWMGKSKS